MYISKYKKTDSISSPLKLLINCLFKNKYFLIVSFYINDDYILFSDIIIKYF